MIDISSKENISTILHSLTKDTKPRFGKMSAQHMIEHLILTVKISSNKIPEKNYYREEKAAAIKAAIIYSDLQMPEGFKAPMLTDELSVLLCTDLIDSIKVLKSEIDYFHSFFSENKNIKTMCPTMGALTYEEWLIFHNKHFTHHFKQFNLI